MNTEIIIGNCLSVLKNMEASSVHAIVTSIPYWGLRSYDSDPQSWGGDPACQHSWEATSSPLRRKPHGKTSGLQKRSNIAAQVPSDAPSSGLFCSKCQAWLGEHGQEPTMQLWLDNALSIFNELYRVLRDDGTLWLNCGDTYATDANGRTAAEVRSLATDNRTFRDKPFSTATRQIPSKNRLMLPARLVIALQEQGWFVRDEIIWAKNNPLPSSARDRTCPAHEMIYLITKKPHYYYDDIAILEPTSPHTNPKRRDGRTVKAVDGGKGFDRRCGSLVTDSPPTLRMKRSVWPLSTEPFRDAHFATFPTALIEPMIKASTSEAGCCAQCATPLRRLTTRVGVQQSDPRGKHADRRVIEHQTSGWVKSCSCPTTETRPAIVLDPFGGSGTVGLVANQLGRNAMLIELNPEYAAIAANRIPRCRSSTSTMGSAPPKSTVRAEQPIPTA